jgi:hypothetical protein
MFPVMDAIVTHAKTQAIGQTLNASRRFARRQNNAHKIW